MSLRFSELDGAAIGVWGAGREIASFAAQLARRLPAARITVVAFDAAPEEDVRRTLQSPDAAIVSGAQIEPALLNCDVIVRSPGVSVYRPEMKALRKTGKPVTTATALWLAEHGSDGVIGVTGTKGKSTTAALTAHLAAAAGRTAVLAGNIGVPVLDLLGEEPTDVVVVELSSYHIADLEQGPEVALVTNLFREHTEWHGSERAYRTDKLHLLELAGVRHAVINARDDGLTEALSSHPRPAVDAQVETTFYGLPHGWDVSDGGIVRRGKPVLASDEIPLRGEHNAMNICGALAALEALGVDVPPLPEALTGFHALPHRLQTVAERNRVLWVDDSISTTPESTLAALASFPDRDVVLIAGGQDRGQDYEQLAVRLSELKATVIGIPTTGPRVVTAARLAGVPDFQALVVPDLAKAVALAVERSAPGSVVLLSPSAPSYDYYRNFEERGRHFRTLARGVKDRRTTTHPEDSQQ
jgi:UDP-N-acetylmuramoyl-L-alanine---L-glutamate ligase